VSTRDAGRWLPRELVWLDDGNLAETAIAAIADAQDVVQADAVAHATACDACAARVGELALVSLATHGALRSAEGRGRALVAVRPSRPLPVVAVLGAIALAAAGVAPLILDLPRWLPHAAVAIVRLSPVLLRGVVAAVRGADSSQALVVSSVSLVVAAMASLVVTWLASTKRSSASTKEGVAS
jgi:hypothetical protein